VPVPDKSVVFSHEIEISLMYLADARSNKIPLLDVIDVETSFQAAKILEAETANDVWAALLTRLITLYPGPPVQNHTTVVCNSRRKPLQHAAAEPGISCRPVAAEDTMASDASSIITMCFATCFINSDLLTA
jgi:hypothetical protein